MNGAAADDDPVARNQDIPTDFLENFESEPGSPASPASWTVGAPPRDAEGADDARPVSDLGNLAGLDPDAKSVIDALR